jgi:lipopolysaccharide exporter
MTEDFRRYWNTYFKVGSFLRNLSIVMSGTALAQVISFAVMPVISRLFTAEDFGIFGTFQSIVGVVSAGITLQYIQAIVLPKEKQNSINVFYASFISVILLTILLFLIIFFFGKHILPYVSLPSVWYVYFVILASFVAGMNQIFQAWCIRVKAFKHTSISQVINSTSSSGIKIVSGCMQVGAIGLILGNILANVAASLNLMRVVVTDLKKSPEDVSLKKIKEMAMEYQDFPLYAMPQNLMNALSQSLPVLLLGYFYGVKVAGFYAFGITMLHAPMRLILGPLRQVLFQKATEVYNMGGDLFKLYLKISTGLAIIGILPTVVFFVFAPEIFSFIFGVEWFQAGIYARWLILWVYAGFTNPPSIIFARILRKQKFLFFYECFVVFSRVMVLIIGGMYFSAEISVMNFAILGMVLNIAIISWVCLLLFYENKVHKGERK